MSDSFTTAPRLSAQLPSPTPPVEPYGYIPSHRLPPHPPAPPALPSSFLSPSLHSPSSLLTTHPTGIPPQPTNPRRLFPYSSLHPRRSQDPERGGYEPESRLPRPRKPQLVQDCTQRFSTRPETFTEKKKKERKKGLFDIVKRMLFKGGIEERCLLDTNIRFNRNLEEILKNIE